MLSIWVLLWRRWRQLTHTLTHTHARGVPGRGAECSAKPIKLICQTLKRRLSTFMFTNPWHICANGYNDAIYDSPCACVWICMSVCACVLVRSSSCHYQGFFLFVCERAGECVHKGLRATKCVPRQTAAGRVLNGSAISDRTRKRNSTQKTSRL